MINNKEKLFNKSDMIRMILVGVCMCLVVAAIKDSNMHMADDARVVEIMQGLSK